VKNYKVIYTNGAGGNLLIKADSYTSTAEHIIFVRGGVESARFNWRHVLSVQDTALIA